MVRAARELDGCVYVRRQIVQFNYDAIMIEQSTNLTSYCSWVARKLYVRLYIFIYVVCCLAAAELFGVMKLLGSFSPATFR